MDARNRPLLAIPRPGVVPSLPPPAYAHPEHPAVEDHHGRHDQANGGHLLREEEGDRERR